MNHYSRYRIWMLAVICVLACAYGCGKKEKETTTPTTTATTPYRVAISSGCAAVDSSGAIAQLDLKAGQVVQWCNEWSDTVVVDFSVAGFLPMGATQLMLQPGECQTDTVEASVVDGSYSWKFDCQGYVGGGGGPVIVDNPPPGP